MTDMVAVALHDGWYGCGTGAGRSNRTFLRALIPMLAPSVRLRILPIRLVPSSAEYDASWHAGSGALLRPGDEVVPVDNGTDGLVRFGDVSHFREACRSAARVMRELAGRSEQIFIAAFDAPFAGLASLLPGPLRSRLVYVPRSTGIAHSPADAARIAFERTGIRTLIQADGQIAAISGYMRTHLRDAYEVPDRHLVDLPNGLSPDDWTLTTSAFPPPPAARDGFIFAMGRAQPYKGFDDLIDALVLVRTRQPVPHLVLAAVTESPQPTPYQRHLAARLNADHIDATLLTRFDTQLRGLLAHPGLAAAIVPSRAEPFGRIMLEAYVGGAPVVTTTAGGLADLARDGYTAFTCPPQQPAALAEAMDRALTATPTEKIRMRTAARAEAARHDHTETVQRFLRRAAPWALRPSGRDLAPGAQSMNPGAASGA
ncbi:MAG TPA: glycosyltransferase family 4 protein [Streptosporangiaceae bacterium]|jgi:glycosyltransferase involved in cell wall biosynthesis